MGSSPSRALLALLSALASLAPFAAGRSVGAAQGTTPAEVSEDEAPAERPEGLTRADLFGSGRRLELTLEAAQRIALASNLGLQIEEASTEIALYNARGSWGQFDWVFGVNGGVTDSEVQQRTELEGAEVLTVNTQFGGMGLTKPVEFGGTFALRFERTNTKTNNAFAVIDPSTTDVLRLNYTQPLLRGFGRRAAGATQDEAEVQYEIQRERLRAARQALLLQVSDAYWNLVLALEQLDVAGSALDLALEQLERDRRVLDAGLGTEIDVLLSEAQVAQRTELLLAADVNVHAAEDMLKQVLFPGTEEATWETRLEPVTPLSEDVSPEGLPPWSQVLVVALEYRSEVRQRLLELDVAEIRHERALSDRKPLLDLSLSASSQGFDGNPSEAFQETIQYEFPTYSAALEFSTPIQNRTGRYAVRAARVAIRAARLAYDQTESQMVGEVRDALRQLRYQAEAIAAAERTLDATRRQLEAEQARNRQGISTSFEVLRLQDEFVRSMSSERSARVAYMKARARLQAVRGTIGELFD